MDAMTTLVPRSRRLAIALILALAGGVAGLTLAAPGDAGAATAKVIGKTPGSSPDPACPDSPCEAVGSVTGFQRVASGKENLFRAKEDGKLVAWKVDLSRPNDRQREFFGDFYENETFGKVPTARIAVIRRTEDRNYRLKRHSPVVQLGGALGDRRLITLGDPLPFKRGDIVALTIPTWYPGFAVGLGARGNEWRASRQSGKCNGARDIRNGRPHLGIGSVREYGCDYDTARLLYWGYYRPTG